MPNLSVGCGSVFQPNTGTKEKKQSLSCHVKREVPTCSFQLVLVILRSSTSLILNQKGGFPSVRMSCSGYPPWILKRAGLESSGRRLISSIGKTKGIAIFFFWQKKYKKKKKKKMLFAQFCQLRRLVFDQSSPVQPISESRGGSLSVTYIGVVVVVVAGLYFSFLIQGQGALLTSFKLGRNMNFPQYQIY